MWWTQKFIIAFIQDCPGTFWSSSEEPRKHSEVHTEEQHEHSELQKVHPDFQVKLAESPGHVAEGHWTHPNGYMRSRNSINREATSKANYTAAKQYKTTSKKVF